MTTLWVLAGIALGVAALAGLLVAAAVFVRAVATLLPPVGQFLGDVQQVREWSARRKEEQARQQRVGVDAAANPTAGPRRSPGSFAPGIAPEPVFEAPVPTPTRPRDDLGPTSASIPTMPVGDLDRWEALTLVEEPPGARPIAPASKVAARPPGPPVEGEEDYGRRTE